MNINLHVGLATILKCELNIIKYTVSVLFVATSAILVPRRKPVTDCVNNPSYLCLYNVYYV